MMTCPSRNGPGYKPLSTRQPCAPLWLDLVEDVCIGNNPITGAPYLIPFPLHAKEKT